MEKRVVNIIMLCAVTGLLVLPLVSAAGFFSNSWGNVGFSRFLDSVFGTTQIATFQQFMVYLAVFLIIFVASADIISNFTGLSTSTGWIVGFALAMIVAASGGLSAFAIMIFGAVAAFGALAIAAVIVSGFVVAFLVHWGFGSLANWIYKRRLMIEAAKGSATAVEGLKALKLIGKETAKKT